VSRWLAGLAAVLAMAAGYALHLRLDGIAEGVDARNHLATGRANYLPGAACVIATTAEHTPADVVSYARACAKAHASWLEAQQRSPQLQPAP